MHWSLYVHHSYPYLPRLDSGVYHPDDSKLENPLAVIAYEHDCCEACAKACIHNRYNDLLTLDTHLDRIDLNYFYYYINGTFDDVWLEYRYDQNSSRPCPEPNEHHWIIPIVKSICMPNGEQGLICKDCKEFFAYAEPDEHREFACNSCKSYQKMYCG